MAESVRERIRKGYIQLLTDGVASVEGRVFSQRKQRLTPGQSAPLMSVYFGDAQESELAGPYPRTIENRVEMSVVAYSAKPPEDVDEELEKIIAEVNAALHAGPKSAKAYRLSGIVKTLNRVRTRLPDPNDLQAPQDVIERVYEVVFYTREDDDSLSL